MQQTILSRRSSYFSQRFSTHSDIHDQLLFKCSWLHPAECHSHFEHPKCLLFIQLLIQITTKIRSQQLAQRSERSEIFQLLANTNIQYQLMVSDQKVLQLSGILCAWCLTASGKTGKGRSRVTKSGRLVSGGARLAGPAVSALSRSPDPRFPQERTASQRPHPSSSITCLPN